MIDVKKTAKFPYNVEDFPLVMFFSGEHKYISRHGTVVKSVTRKLKEVQYPYDQEYWLNSGAIKEVNLPLWKTTKKELYPEYRMKPPKEFLKDCVSQLTKAEKKRAKKEKAKLAWKWLVKKAVASSRGTEFHSVMEQKDLKRGKAKNPFTGEYQDIVKRPDLTFCDNATIYDNLYDLPDGYYPELLVFHFFCPKCGLEPDDCEHGFEGYCGQVDRCWITTDKTTGVRYADFDDWKTNWAKRKDGGMDKFKEPIDHLRTSKSNIYALQQSFYAYMMELAGFTPRHLQITWVKDFQTTKKFWEPEILPYLRTEIECAFFNPIS